MPISAWRIDGLGEQVLVDMLYNILIDPFVQMGPRRISSCRSCGQVSWPGTLYSLIALGFVLIFKASGVFNFAQGIMVVFAALTLVGLYEAGVPAWAALFLTVGAMFVLPGWLNASCCATW